jgi:hypothetical protein
MRRILPIVAALGLAASTAAAQQPGLQAKVFNFPEIHSGACVMPPGATLTLYSNGTGQFNGETVSGTVAPAVWHIMLYVEAQNGTTLFYSGGFQSPPMAQNQHYPLAGTLNYDAGLFPLAVRARAWTSC